MIPPFPEKGINRAGKASGQPLRSILAEKAPV